jgi:hypothetical protein
VPLTKLQALSTQCRSCGVTQVCRLRSTARGGTGLCAQCDDVSRSSKTEQALLLQLLAEGIPPPSAVDSVMVGGPSCSVGRRRPDIAWVSQTHVVNLELDEDSHAGRIPACEVSKAQETRFGAEHGTKPLVLIRYNPDQYDGEGYQSTAARVKYLAKVVRFCLQQTDISELSNLQPNVVFLFYHSRSNKHVLAAQQAAFPTLVLPPPATPVGLKGYSALPDALRKLARQFELARA